jgi:hypothetical protein
MEAAAGAAAQAPAPQCVVCGAPTTTDVVPHEARKRQRKNKRGSRGARGRANQGPDGGRPPTEPGTALPYSRFKMLSALR